MDYWVYVLANPEQKTYVGQTADLDRRLAQHNEPNFRGTVHTKRRKGPWRLIHSEPFSTRAEAMRREKALKTGRGREFIKGLFASGC
jgi:putative endonuclease